jgi:hypothetical protein
VTRQPAQVGAPVPRARVRPAGAWEHRVGTAGRHWGPPVSGVLSVISVVTLTLGVALIMLGIVTMFAALRRRTTSG